tara:strand:- start:18 stop:362 length:345 start_codon:yes stop_codon:yes gene_type:complete
MENNKNMRIVNDCLKCQALDYQFTEIDTEDGLHDGTPKGIRNYYTDEGILEEALNRVEISNANRDPDGSWCKDYQEYQVDYIQLQKFIRKWINKVNISSKTLKTELTKIINDII